jgi:hypothetical protein
MTRARRLRALPASNHPATTEPPSAKGRPGLQSPGVLMRRLSPKVARRWKLISERRGRRAGRREHVFDEVRRLVQEGYVAEVNGKRRLTPSGRHRLQCGPGEPGTGLGTGALPPVPKAA